MTHDTAWRWSVRARSSSAEPMALFCRGHRVDELAAAGAKPLQPVEYLLTALVTCFVMSCRAALVSRQLHQIAYEVIAGADKAPDGPNRVGHIALIVRFDTGIVEREISSVVKSAEEICTVSNTLLVSPNIVVSAHLADDMLN